MTKTDIDCFISLHGWGFNKHYSNCTMSLPHLKHMVVFGKSSYFNHSEMQAFLPALIH